MMIGVILSFLYLITYYLTPVTIFGALAAYRMQLILAFLVVLFSVPALLRTFIFKSPQLLALLGMALAVPVSIIAGIQWFQGALNGFLEFIPNAFAFFLICLHFRTVRRLKLLVGMLFFVCAFVIVHGYIAKLHGFPAEVAHQPGFEGSPYLMAMQNNAGEWFYRLRGLGDIHDPNDFAQLLVSVLPLLFLLWRSGRLASNFLLVVLPSSVLLFGVFLTHSRGALLALLVVLIVAIRPKIGSVPAAVLAGILFVVAKAFQFAGDRSISLQSGSDRTSLWGQGLGVFKEHLLFGVGYGRLPDYTDVHLTAHNSVVVCAAELGFFGLYCWSLFLFPTVRDAITLSNASNLTARIPEDQESGDPDVSVQIPPGMPARQAEICDPKMIHHYGRVILLSLTGYLTAAWFLSRAYVVTLFLLGGVAEVIYQMALEQGMVGPRLRLSTTMFRSGMLAVALIVLMYVLLRVVNVIH